jgi:hypothetical protein
MKVPQNRNLKLNELTKHQVHRMALETLKNNLALLSAGDKAWTWVSRQYRKVNPSSFKSLRSRPTFSNTGSTRIASFRTRSAIRYV